MKIHTESGSVYEIEPNGEGYRVRRRVNGSPAPDNVRATEQWQDALELSEIAVGLPLRISWRRRGAFLESTFTSVVTAIITEEPN